MVEAVSAKQTLETSLRYFAEVRRTSVRPGANVPARQQPRYGADGRRFKLAGQIITGSVDDRGRPGLLHEAP